MNKIENNITEEEIALFNRAFKEIQEMKDEERKIFNRRRTFTNDLSKILAQCEDRDILQDAYWKYGIRSFVKKAARLRKISQHEYREMYISSVLKTCKKCGHEYYVVSHGALISEYGCPKCQESHNRVIEEHHLKRETEEANERKRQARLDNMPYKEYLKTPEWQENRVAHLKYAKYRCQLCNSEGKLHVHHKHYINARGHENWRDLIVLCEKCHYKFHEEVSV